MNRSRPILNYLFLLLLFTDGLRAQTNSLDVSTNKIVNSGKKLPDFSPILELNAITSALAYGATAQFKPKSSKEVISDLESDIGSTAPEEIEMIVSHREVLKNLFAEFDLIGSQLGEFAYMKVSLPLDFVSKDGSTALLVRGIISESVFNTQKTTSKTRASQIISSMILPSLKNFNETCSTSTDIGEFGISVIYGSKDFTDDSIILNLKPETIVFFVSRDKCKQFVEGKITEDEVVKSADIYLTDRDMVTGFKKITVNLE